MLTLFICMLAVFCGLASTSTAAGPPTFLHKRGSFGSGGGQFNAPTSIAVDWMGLVYVADSGNHRIRLFDFPCVVAPSSWCDIKARYR